MSPKRKTIPVAISIMVHVVALSYFAFETVPDAFEESETVITLRPQPRPEKEEAHKEASAPLPPAKPVRPARTEGRRVRRANKAVPIQAENPEGAVPGELAELDEPVVAGSSSVSPFAQEGPPRPAGLPRIPTLLPFVPEEEEEDGIAVERSVRTREEAKRVEPTYGPLESSSPQAPDEPPNERGSLATGQGRAGGGITFDFWSPLDPDAAIAAARAEILPKEEKLDREKHADLGHGVICNNEGFWFICKEDDIEECNERNDGMCRFAKGLERAELNTPVIF